MKKGVQIGVMGLPSHYYLSPFFKEKLVTRVTGTHFEATILTIFFKQYTVVLFE